MKFIRDQAQAALAEVHREHHETHKGPAAGAQAAASAVKKFLVGEGGSPAPTVEFVPQTVSKLPSSVDPLQGWAEGVSARKGHFCLLLKPQIVLRSNDDDESVCILAAVQGKLKTFSIMDNANEHDPVSGKVMNRSVYNLRVSRRPSYKAFAGTSLGSLACKRSPHPQPTLRAKIASPWKC